MSWTISSIECGEIPSSPIPGMSGDDVLSICISSTWFRVIGGLGNISAIRANACQAANGTGSNSVEIADHQDHATRHRRRDALMQPERKSRADEDAERYGGRES